MKRLISLAAPFFAALAFSASVSAMQNDEAVIRQMERTLMQASMHHDRDTLKPLLDDAYREFTPSGAGRTKNDVLSAPPAPAGSTQTLKDLEVRVDGDRTIATGENYFMAPNGQAALIAFRDEFVRRDGQWRAVGSWMSRR